MTSIEVSLSNGQRLGLEEVCFWLLKCLLKHSATDSCEDACCAWGRSALPQDGLPRAAGGTIALGTEGQHGDTALGRVAFYGGLRLLSTIALLPAFLSWA